MNAPKFELFENWHSWVGGDYRYNAFWAKIAVPLFLLLSIKYIPEEKERATFYGLAGFEVDPVLRPELMEIKLWRRGVSE